MPLIGWTDLNGGASNNGQLLSNKKRWCLRHGRHGLPGLVTHTCRPNTWEKSKSKGQLELHNKFQASLGYMLRSYLQKPNQEDKWYGEHYKVKHAGMNRIYSISFNYLKFFKKAKRGNQKLSVVRTSGFKVGSLFRPRCSVTANTPHAGPNPQTAAEQTLLYLWITGANRVLV